MPGDSKDSMETFTWSLKSEVGKTPRAPRFTTKSPLRFRMPGQEDWSEGVTFNVSPTGVLFRADGIVKMHSIVQMNFALPAGNSGQEGKVVFCRGRIVRTVMPPVCDGQPHMAAKILDYLPGNDRERDRHQIAGDAAEPKNID